ncbi:MAG: LON peptidase substrate-binding domain-containing protein [Candidatus Acidiferrales bacterium]
MRPKRIPVFPLDVVLLPGMPMPLHIFEPRYKLMIGRCLAEKIEFGMIFARERSISQIGCTAEIVQKVKDYPDGRMDILAEGRAVFRVAEFLDEKEYYEAKVEYFSENATPQDARLETRLTELFEQCHTILLGRAWTDSRRRGDVSLAYQMAALLPLELNERQALLEIRDEPARRDFLLQRMAEILPKITHRQTIRRLAGGNGHGLN